MKDTTHSEPLEGLDIAIIGMSGRFPGANNIHQFWENLKTGVESIRFFTDDELLAAGDDPALVNNPNYIKARGILEAIDQFDATFFGFFPKEAEMLDPQHRLFLECTWEALEDAGHDADRYSGLIGLFAGVSLNTYIMHYVTSRGSISTAEGYQLTIGNDKDFLATKTSYKLNLKGPSMAVQTACSTSLTAIYLACQNLLSYQCDMALAGGTSIVIPQERGYMYQEGMILSGDGHCRAFDAKASGTVSGNGIGVVVLKRLADALADRDHIYAVIKGSACNNDGSMRVGFTAPGVEGQADVIAMAQAAAGVEPDTISYIETHGTGTTLGDPIEIAALTQVFRERTEKVGFCPIGSVKTNIGHLDAAAGVAGVIKTALMLKHRLIPPSLHFEKPNPQINFQNSPFFVNTELREWKAGETPRRAGVSSFGIGGTNVHVVLEEAPARQVSGEGRSYQLIALSAKSETALEKMTTHLVRHLQQQPDLQLADVAYTLLLGRKAFPQRQLLVCQSVNEAVEALDHRNPEKIMTSTLNPDRGEARVAFMFSGQGSQYVNMGRELYETEPLFREQVDTCAELLTPVLKLDLREILFPPPEKTEIASEKLNETALTQPALFVIEYALAKLWLAWGIEPQVMLGHSIGEYVAACLAGVFSLEDALLLVANRGRLMQSLQTGAMLSIPLEVAQLEPFLNDELDLAAINAPQLCAVSGSFEAIAALEKKLTENKIDYRRLHTSHAFHSKMMDPILEPFTEIVRGVKLNPPQLPYLSNVSGTWITVEQATDPAYYTQHLRQTVNFAAGVGEALADPDRILLEVGPGKALTTLARQQIGGVPGRVLLSSLRHPQEKESDEAFLMQTLGRLWLAGVEIDWEPFYAGEARNRLALPTYPFERQRFWLDGARSGLVTTKPATDSLSKRELTDWFYAPSWKRVDWPATALSDEADKNNNNWLIFVDDRRLASQITKRLEGEGTEVITIRKGEQFAQTNQQNYSINPKRAADYAQLIAELKEADKIPERIIHFWNVTSGNQENDSLSNLLYDGFYSLIFLTQALGQNQVTTPIELVVVSNDLHEVTGREKTNPIKATLLGPCKVIPQEYPHITCRQIDLSGAVREKRLVEKLVAELASHSTDLVVAFREQHRWVQTFEPISPAIPTESDLPLRPGGVYLITGGLGRIGLTFTEYLGRKVGAKLVLIDRPPFPDKAEWEDWLKQHSEADPVYQKIKRLMEIESNGGTIEIFLIDVTVEPYLQQAIDEIYQQFGQLNGVIHAAGFVGEQSMKVIQELTPADCNLHFQAKVEAVRLLAKVLDQKALDFCLLQSSLAAILGGLGMTAYAAANAFMDAFAAQPHQAGEIPWLSANWDGWNFDTASLQNASIGAKLAELAITPEEGVRALEVLLSMKAGPQVIVSTGDLQARLNQWIKREPKEKASTAEESATTSLHPRPNLPNPYVAPETALQQEIAGMWQTLLGIEKIGIYDNFFELGGHSLLATQLVSRLRETFQVELPLRELFESPKIETLAGIIEKARGGTDETQQEISEMLNLVAAMSDEDVKTMLEEKQGNK